MELRVQRWTSNFGALHESTKYGDSWRYLNTSSDSKTYYPNFWRRSHTHISIHSYSLTRYSASTIHIYIWKAMQSQAKAKQNIKSNYKANRPSYEICTKLSSISVCAATGGCWFCFHCKGALFFSLHEPFSSCRCYVFSFVPSFFICCLRFSSIILLLRCHVNGCAFFVVAGWG